MCSREFLRLLRTRTDMHMSISIGNFHLSPGRSFQSNAMHVHDLVPYLEGGQHHDFGHEIHKFSFGSETEQISQNNAETERLKKKLNISDPLTGIKAHTEESNYMFQYFLKVVSTRFETIDRKMLSTHQYSVTSYERDLNQSNAPAKEAGHTTTHGFAGVPGVFFSVGRCHLYFFCFIGAYGNPAHSYFASPGSSMKFRRCL